MRFFGLGGREKAFEFRCSDCGAIHRGSPSFSYLRPARFYEMPEAERAQRSSDSDDLCIVRPKPDGRDGNTAYFIRVVLEIPIVKARHPFIWGVWVSQSEENFHRYAGSFGSDQSGQTSFGRLPVDLPYYRGSNGYATNLESDVHWGKPGKRPHLRLRHNDHPLVFDQSNGISWDKAIEIARLAMHGRE